MAHTHKRDRHRSMTKHPCIRRAWVALSLGSRREFAHPCYLDTACCSLLSHWYTLGLLLSAVLLALACRRLPL